MKKTYLVFCCIFAFFSCSSDVDIKETAPLENSQQTPSTYSIQKAKETANNLFCETITRGLSEQEQDDYPYDEAVNELETNLEYAVTNDIYILLKEQGYRESIADAIYDYYNGASLETLVYQYQITEEELQVLANACACIDYINQEQVKNQTRGIKRDTVSCTLAVASSVACTIGAMGITTPVGSGIFLVSKAIATASLAICASR